MGSLELFYHYHYHHYHYQVHQLYEKHWDRYKTKSTDNPNFKDRQLTSLLCYNADQRMRLEVTKRRRTRNSEREE